MPVTPSALACNGSWFPRRTFVSALYLILAHLSELGTANIALGNCRPTQKRKSTINATILGQVVNSAYSADRIPQKKHCSRRCYEAFGTYWRVAAAKYQMARVDVGLQMRAVPSME